MTDHSRVHVIVTLDGTRAMSDVVPDLVAKGLAVEAELAAIANVTGFAASPNLADLESVPGVSDVAESGEVDIGPPGSPDTW